MKLTLMGILFIIGVFLFGSRDAAGEKDFFYFNPSQKMRKLLYVRDIPEGEITLTSLASQCLLIFVMFLQLLCLLGVNVSGIILQIVYFGHCNFELSGGIPIQIAFCVGYIYLPIQILIIVYFIICGIFAKPRNPKWIFKRK